MSLAKRIGDDVYQARAHMMHGETLYRLGAFAPAREHFIQGLALYAPHQHDRHIALFGNDTGVLCYSINVLVLWQLGYAEQALETSIHGLTLAEECSHPITLTCALYFKAVLHKFRREWISVQGHVKTLVSLSSDHGFALYGAWGTILYGALLAEQGEVAEGHVAMRRGMATWRATGAELILPACLADIAAACAKEGMIEQGLSAVNEALALVDRNGERAYEAELNRLKGELLWQQPSDAIIIDAEACFLQAKSVASRQQAKSWELRASMSLSALWREQGKNEQAGRMLAATYDWFAEGFDTADPQEARAMLEVLGVSRML
ncbi:MAG: hypothetical protein GY759_22710 [Chloroflexi bacterium]|nr:hypothetical protein [Chloroflexota bacterium]